MGKYILYSPTHGSVRAVLTVYLLSSNVLEVLTDYRSWFAPHKKMRGLVTTHKMRLDANQKECYENIEIQKT